MIATQTKFKIGDRVRIVNNWVEDRKAAAVIRGFQSNGNMTFAQVKWLGKTSELTESYGTLFPLDELKKV